MIGYNDVMLTNTLSPYPMTTPIFEVVTMTPQWASQLLGQSAQKNRKYKNLMEWDLSLSLDREGGRWNYDIQIEPQDEDDQPELEAAWEKV